ncbi:uncharacterized protein [Clytia hemisphaerica]|uniref:uncharacterized protein n=1 Tax=Clytia hemisphaerica TaxID=252671 RepID=UPI0034D7AB38
MIVTTFLAILISSRISKSSSVNTKNIPCEDYIAGDRFSACHNGYIFTYVPQKLLPFDGILDCNARGGHLATLQTLDDLVVSEGLIARNNAQGEVVLGGTLTITIPVNTDGTEVNPLIPTPQDGFISSINVGDSTFNDISSVSYIDNTPYEYLCKFVYHGNSKAYITFKGVLDGGEIINREEIDCGENGQLKTFTNFNKVARITKELSLRTRELRYFIGAKFDTATLKLIWDNGSKSLVRNWCSSPPSIDNPNHLDPAPEQCVMVTSSGCWVLQDCQSGPPEFRNYICDFDRRGSLNSENNDQLLTLVNVLRAKIDRITKDCQTCSMKH